MQGELASDWQSPTWVLCGDFQVAVTTFSTSLHVLERDDMDLLFYLGNSYHQCEMFLKNLNCFKVKGTWVALVPILLHWEC